MKLIPYAYTCALAALVPLFGSACTSKADKPKPKPFVAGAWKTYKNDTLGIQLKRPANLKLTLGKNKVSFSAPGFGQLDVRVTPTKDTHILMNRKEYLQGRVERTLVLPGRNVTCFAKKLGKHHDLGRRICESLVFTKKIATKVRVKRTRLTLKGEPKDTKAFHEALARAQQAIAGCWKATIAIVKYPPEGTLMYRLVLRADGNEDQHSLSYPTTWNDNPRVRPCFLAALKPLRPKPNGRPVTLELYLDLLAY